MKIRIWIALFAALAAASAAQALENEVTNTVKEISNADIAGQEAVDYAHAEENATGNRLIITASNIHNNNSPLHNSAVIGAWANTGIANGNQVEISTSSIDRSIYGGYTPYGTQANGNSVTVTASSVNPNAPLSPDTTLTDYQVEHRVDAQGDTYTLSSVIVDSVQISGAMGSGDPSEKSNYNIYGGVVGQGEAAYNSVLIQDAANEAAPIGNNIIGAYSPYLSETYLHDNTVEITNSYVNGLVAGAAGLGASWDITVRQPLRNDNNTVRLTNAFAHDIIGAYGGISTDGNTVSLDHSNAHHVYGASFGQNIFYSNGQPTEIENTANENTVSLTNGSSASGNVYGAQSHSVQAAGNRVEIISGSRATGNIFGAHISNARVQQDPSTVGWNTAQTLAQQNTVFLQNAEAGNAGAQIAGALNFSGAANANTVQIENSSVNASVLAGGWAEHERQTLSAQGQQDFSIGYQADHNNMVISESRLTASVYGGLVTREDNVNPDGLLDTALSSASYNQLNISASSVTGNVYGAAAYGDYTQTDGNQVTLSDTQVDGSIYGALAQGENASSSGNKLILHNTSVNGDVYAADAKNGGGHSVTLSGTSSITGEVYGGAGTGNQLTLLNYQSEETLKLSGFDLPYLIVGADTSVIFDQNVHEAHLVVEGTEDINGRILIRTPSADSSFTLHAANSGVYTYSLSPQAEASGMTAWILNGGFSVPRAHSYGQTGLLALALANASDALLDDVLQTAAQNGRSSGTFFKAGYEHLKHDTGSGFTLRATTAIAGIYKKNDAFAAGLYARYSYGGYTLYPVRADSYAEDWAGGLFGGWAASERLRLTADMRVGWQKTSYGGSETGADFDYQSPLLSLQAGALYKLDEELHAQAKLRWTHVQGDSMTNNLSERIHINGLDGLLGTLSLTYRPAALSFGRFSPMAQAEVLHEFNGRAVSAVEERRIEDLSLRGTSARARLGLIYTNTETGLTAALNAFAQGGQQDGWGGEINAAWHF